MIHPLPNYTYILKIYWVVVLQLSFRNLMNVVRRKRFLRRIIHRINIKQVMQFFVSVNFSCYLVLIVYSFCKLCQLAFLYDAWTWEASIGTSKFYFLVFKKMFETLSLKEFNNCCIKVLNNITDKRNKTKRKS